MTRRRGSTQGAGPLGTAANSPIIDRGTLARTQHLPPGAQSHASLGTWQVSAKRTEYLAYARSVSYLMQAKSEGEGALAWMGKELRQLGISSDSKPARVQSALGGAFLRMYLDGKVDAGIVANASEEIGQSTEFKHISVELNSYLQATIDRLKIGTIDPGKLAKMADHHLKSIKAKSGIAFRATLNAVIGGVTDVAVKAVTRLGQVDTPKGLAGRYRIDITFYDVYDFGNKRYGEYDRYRKELARHLLANDFEQFEELYSQEAHHPFDQAMRKTKLDNAVVFASYMYALEKKRWTPGGLAWDVTVPTEAILLPATQHTHR